MKNKSAKSVRLDSATPVSVRLDRETERSRISRLPSQEEITARARQLWQDRGCPVDRDLEIWVEAERQLSLSGRAISGLPVTADTEDEVEEAEKVQDRIADTAAPAPDRSPTSL
jgi:hypothetical protein